MYEKLNIEKSLSKIGIHVFPEKTNFIFIKTKISYFDIKLKEKGVLIKELSDEWFDGYYRISVGLTEENNILLSAIKKIYKNA